MNALSNCPTVQEIRLKSRTSSVDSGIAIAILGLSMVATSTIIATKSIVSELSEYSKDLIYKLEKFKKLKPGFDSYNSDTPSLVAISSAIKFIKESDRKNLPLYFVAPGRNSDVLVELSNKASKSAEIYFNSDNTIEQLLYENEVCVYESKFDFKVLEVFFSS